METFNLIKHTINLKEALLATKKQITMIYKKTNPTMRKYYLQKKAEAKKGNQAIANKIQIFANAEINKVVENKAGKLAYHEGKAYNNPNTLTELININKPKIDKEYSKLINSPKTSDTFHHQIQVQNRANDQAKKISQAQYEQIQKNIKAVEQVIDKYGIKLEKYRELNEKYPKTISRKGIITESIENKNYITSLGKNIVPHLDGYKELSHLTEHLHRQAQNQASEELARAENEEAIKNGQKPPNDEKKWIWTGAGATTRHYSNDGQVVPIDEPFTIVNDVTGEVNAMMYPLDPAVYSSNTFICYCEVEYGHFSENKFALTTDMIQAFDNAIKNLTIEADTHPMKVDVENNYFADEVETWAYMSDKIQDKDIKLATELLSEYSKVTNLEALPVEETFQVLQNHYNLQTVNELGKMTKKFNDTPLNEKNSFTKLSEALELVKKQSETLQIVETPKATSEQVRKIEKELEFDVEYFLTETKTASGLYTNIDDIYEAFVDLTKNKKFTKEEINHLEEYINKILKEYDDFKISLKDTINYDHWLPQAEMSKNNLESYMKQLKEEHLKQKQAEQTITETTEAIDNLVEDYDEIELQLEHEQALQEVQKAEEKVQQEEITLEPATKLDMDSAKGSLDVVTSAIKSGVDSSSQLANYVKQGEEMFKDDINNKVFLESQVKQIEKYVDELQYEIDKSALDLKQKEGVTNIETASNINDAYDHMDNIIEQLNNLKDNARKDSQQQINEENVRPTIEILSSSLENYSTFLEQSKVDSQLGTLVDKFKDNIRVINRSTDTITNKEVERLCQESNNLKKAIEQNLQRNDYAPHEEQAIRVLKDKIPDERIIRKCKDLLEGENINFKYSQNIAQGKATISYLKRFEPMKPSQKIIDKFNKQKPFTEAEIKHLTENIGELRYLMELCDQAVIEGGATNNPRVDYRPVGLTENCESMYGREPLDPKFDEYDDMIRTWVAGCDGDINECRDYMEQYGETEARNEYSDRYVDFALQVKELGETTIPKAYTSYRGNRRSPHILDNLIGDSVGETSYRAGMRYVINKDLCTSITEAGTGSFSGLSENGTVSRVMITMLHPPNSNGNYLDNKSGLRGETELIKTRGTQMQLLLFDEATDTYLAWECYD